MNWAILGLSLLAFALAMWGVWTHEITPQIVAAGILLFMMLLPLIVAYV